MVHYGPASVSSKIEFQARLRDLTGPAPRQACAFDAISRTVRTSTAASLCAGCELNKTDSCARPRSAGCGHEITALGYGAHAALRAGEMAAARAALAIVSRQPSTQYIDSVKPTSCGGFPGLPHML